MTAEPEPVSAVAPPLPGPPIIEQRWRDAVFLHWRIRAADAAPLLPPGTRPDEHDGSTWVGLIPFRLEASRVPPLPPVPWLGTFLETNVRLYAVDERGRRSVVFLTLEAQHAVPVLTARIGIGLPYRWARMRTAARDGTLGYASERLTGRRGPRTRIRVRTTDDPVAHDPLADFLTARWAMHVQRGDRTTYWRNSHEPWPLFRAELLELRDELLADSGFPGLAARPPDSVLWSPGVTARFSAPLP